MPGMRLFGRRCSLATDDFLLIGIIDFVVFLPCLGWVPVVYSSFLKQRDSCSSDTTRLLLDVSLPGLCALFFANWLLGALFIYFSTRGTILDPEPRRHVITLVYIKLIVSILDVVWAVLGIVILFQDCSCDIIGVSFAIKICTALQLMATFGRFILVFILYDWNFAKKKTKEGMPKEFFTTPVRKGAYKRWHIRMQAVFLLWTAPADARRQALETACELLSILTIDLDLVLSDVIAGLMIFRQKCLEKYKVEKAAREHAPIMASADGLPIERFPTDDIPSWMNLQTANRYLTICLGIFGWQWYLVTHLLCGVWAIFNRLFCCLPCRKHSKVIIGDNCCGCSVAGLRATTRLPYEDLVHVSFVDGIFEVPYYITYDHETSAIILTVRGTMSMSDVLTDLTAGFSRMDDPGMPEGAVCHMGMLNAARQIKKKLEKSRILDEALEKYPSYQLVFTGHSLGASVASVLCVLFRESRPGVRCFAFCPAPTLNAAALPISFDCVFTLCYRNDIVGFMNYENVNRMVNEMVGCLRECRLPKHKIFLSGGKAAIQKNKGELSHKNGKDIKRNGAVNGTTPAENHSVNVDLERSSAQEKLHLAGTILHIWPHKNEYRIRVSSSQQYKPLSLRPNAFWDHFPRYVQLTLRDLGKHPVLESSTVRGARTWK